MIENIPRVLPEGCAVELDTQAWRVPPIFRLIQREGGIAQAEMARVFNMGLGIVLIVGPEHTRLIEEAVPESIVVGRVVRQDGDSRVTLAGDGGE